MYIFVCSTLRIFNKGLLTQNATEPTPLARDAPLLVDGDKDTQAPSPVGDT